jgi:hypothetical protein
MKNTKTLFLGIVLLTALTFIGCKKKGCTDADATDYCSNCKSDAGSCQFEGKMVFWYGKTVADSSVANGKSSYTYYIDGQLVGSSAASVYYTIAPNCGQSGTVSVTKPLGTVKSKSSAYVVKDDAGVQIWAGTINFTANTCVAQELAWQ